MALDSIVIGCDWSASILVTPTDGRTEADVVADLTGATVSASLHDANGDTLVVGTALVTSASNRKISLSLLAAATTSLQPTRSCAWDVRVLQGARVLPVAVFDRIDVQDRTV